MDSVVWRSKLYHRLRRIGIGPRVRNRLHRMCMYGVVLDSCAHIFWQDPRTTRCTHPVGGCLTSSHLASSMAQAAQSIQAYTAAS